MENTESIPTLYMIRHGSTANNEKNLIRGWLDLPLSDKGLQEGSDAGNRLMGAPIDAMVSSDLLRARQTAQAISDKTGIPVIGKSFAMRPWDLGELTGEPGDIAHKEIERVVRGGHHDEKITGSGESFNEFKSRFLDGLIDILEQHGDKRLAIVAHHRNERLVDSLLPNGEIDYDKFLSMGVPPASYMEQPLSKIIDHYYGTESKEKPNGGDGGAANNSSGAY